MPVAIKDDCDVAGDVTGHGSDAFDVPAPADAEVVRRLRGAGAIVIGKTHVPELEIVPATESAAWGTTRNPWDLGRTPGGSSGGTAAAVAAGMAGGGLGSDGGGSIRIPAGCCGLFGIKPQRDRVPVAPRARTWNGLSVFGPITRTVADAALFLDVTADGGGGFAAAAARAPGRLRIALSLKVPPGVFVRPDAEQRGAVERVAERLRALGHAVEEHDPAYGNLITWFTVRYLRGIREDGEGRAAPAAAGAPDPRLREIGGGVPGRAAAPRCRGGRLRPRAPGALAGGFDVLLTPMFTRRPLPIGQWEGRGGDADVQRQRPLGALLRGLEPHRAAGGLGPRRTRPTTGSRSPSSSSAVAMARRRCCRSPPSSRRELDWPSLRPPL